MILFNSCYFRASKERLRSYMQQQWTTNVDTVIFYVDTVVFIMQCHCKYVEFASTQSNPCNIRQRRTSGFLSICIWVCNGKQRFSIICVTEFSGHSSSVFRLMRIIMNSKRRNLNDKPKRTRAATKNSKESEKIR